MALSLDHYELLDKLPAPGSQRDPRRQLRSRIPVGGSGEWKVEKFTVKKCLNLLRDMRDGRGTTPGQYTRLMRHGEVIMSDTDAELDDLSTFFRRAKGRVLINGLGLGIAVQGVLAKEEVTHIDVVEISRDVIQLVAPHIIDDRIAIHHGDCFSTTWPRGSRWDCVWHDIWDGICSDNIPEMSALKRKFGRRTGWQGCWAEDWIRR